MSRAVANGVRGEAQAFPAQPPGATCPCQNPHRKLHAGVFFDGTNNNRDRDKPKGKHTNVVRLWTVWREGSSADALLKKMYVDGVGSMDVGARVRQAGSETARGTVWWNPLSAVVSGAVSGGRLIGDLGHDVGGMMGGLGGKERLNRAFFWLKDRCGEVPGPGTKTVDVYGFSRGAALARTFVNLVNMAMRQQIPTISVRFVGVYDTVGSFGMAGDDSDPGQNMYIDATDARGISHFVARHEVRQNFPLTVVTGVDVEYPGVHSDVGGGYEGAPGSEPDEDGKFNHLSFVTFKDMHRDSVRCGVVMDPWEPQVTGGVDVEDLRRRSNIYAGGGQNLTAPGSPWLGEQAEFFERYVHESAVRRSNWWHAAGPLGSAYVLLNPHKPDSTGARRKFTPRRFRLKGQPPDFDWE
ncbi:T6SS phospholipase effector Tle1-like catalytic domain-containing protein [Nannocystis pusilla]|uniref:DUF2235 domain-containing protein n=1 Tax=Nannocystis pusilla TaxID=889268 RepID=A0ABS7U1R3_9BACT|nr:DUF2235 domain-containing protein [Nannocystis pusilla]MBZ5714280.1 DUF2235 domain-containing protein [Nannocystis pusilla]